MWSIRWLRHGGLCIQAVRIRKIQFQLQRLPAIVVSQFHSGQSHFAKLFIDKENNHAHNVLEQSRKSYQIFRLDTQIEASKQIMKHDKLPIVVLSPPISEDVSTEVVLDALSAVTDYCSSTNTRISDDRFQLFTELLCAKIHTLTDEQLWMVVRKVIQLPLEDSSKSANYIDIWNSLDMECCRRIERWSTDELLFACDAWYILNLPRICEFVWEALRKLGRKVRRMRPEQLVHAMFFCNLVRRPVFEMFDFEVNLMQCVDKISLQELGVMSMGFFKTQTPIRNPELIELLYKRLTAELDTVDDITLVAILKILRYSSKLPMVELMKQLLNDLQSQVNRISLLSCLHVALFGVELQCCNDNILKLVVERFNNEVEHLRLKDMERICLAIGVFNYRSATGVEQDLCAKILTIFQSRVDEILRYPRCFTNCLHYLTLSGYYDKEMLSSVMERKFIEHAYGKNLKLGREMFHLDSFLKINLKENYEGAQLPDKMRQTMGKVLTHYIPERNPKYKLNTTDRILMEMKETFNRFMRPNSFKHILPHFERPDIVICYDNKLRKAIPLSPQCAEDYKGVILSRKELLGDAERQEIDTVAVVIGGWNNFVREKDRHTGLFDMKLKQLCLLGHKYIVIYWHEWREQETPIDRQHFLRKKLVNVIDL